ncbi:MAG: pyridoxamine 5'-phosphate oxidase [Candidatus Eisenbacteria bacterium]
MSLTRDPLDALPPLDPAHFAADPMTQFDEWYALAESRWVVDPEDMSLATATSGGAPSVRLVLLKGADARGFRFFTNHDSRKGQELSVNPRAALVLYWKRLGRQVRAEGIVTRVPAAESDAYFASRPAGSRFAAAASPQSEVIHDRAELEARVAALRERHPSGDVPRPANWGGYRLTPERVEFWQQGADRLHDRLRYRRDGAGWVVERLAP